MGKCILISTFYFKILVPKSKEPSDNIILKRYAKKKCATLRKTSFQKDTDYSLGNKTRKKSKQKQTLRGKKYTCVLPSDVKKLCLFALFPSSVILAVIVMCIHPPDQGGENPGEALRQGAGEEEQEDLLAVPPGPPVAPGGGGGDPDEQQGDDQDEDSLVRQQDDNVWSRGNRDVPFLLFLI